MNLNTVYDIIVSSVKKEMVPDGLLSDAKSLVNTYFNQYKLDYPVIWVTQQPSFGSESTPLGKVIDFTIPFEFDCGVYHSNIDEANRLSQDLTTRVISSVLKNWRFQQSELSENRIIKSITLNTFYPAGFIDVNGKSSKVMMTGCILNINVRFDWNKCIRPENNNNNVFNKYMEIVNE